MNKKLTFEVKSNEAGKLIFWLIQKWGHASASNFVQNVIICNLSAPDHKVFEFKLRCKYNPNKFCLLGIFSPKENMVVIVVPQPQYCLSLEIGDGLAGERDS